MILAPLLLAAVTVIVALAIITGTVLVEIVMDFNVAFIYSRVPVLFSRIVSWTQTSYSPFHKPLPVQSQVPFTSSKVLLVVQKCFRRPDFATALHWMLIAVQPEATLNDPWPYHTSAYRPAGELESKLIVA